ncbi:hypothetical protein F2P81_000575 [Scophthalmus maximus]|uniref:GYF domain-containing protein n=1 Tax=Scophthalmus maximus TaxID=52904 RepID=A0A6A4TY23_SCOMX|nr:hypothetical protein F2P81_000575 [Scophthalmus maximus]
MAETQTLNFGPEWLRALSGGGGGGVGGVGVGGGGGGGGSSNTIASPPLSPALPKYKLADYRYGREEMLALYVKDNKIPIDLQDKEFLPILQEEPLPPLALVSFTEDEQRNFSMSVNSAAVLRLTGRGAGPIVGAPRGRSTSRGRVRVNYEDSVPGLPRKHDFTRSESENWRSSRDDQNGEDDWVRLEGCRWDSDRWCPPSPDAPRSAGWRELPDQRRRFPFDAREDERGYRRPRSGSGSLEDERDSLPEWCLEDADEEAGTFDSSGAFLSLKKASKEPILEEAELDFKPLDECEEGLEEDGRQPKETKETEAKREVDRKELARVSEEAPPVLPPVAPTVSEPQATGKSLSPNQSSRTEETERPAERQPSLELPPETCKMPLHLPMSNSRLEVLPMTRISTTLAEVSAPSPSVQLLQQKPMAVPVAMNNLLPFPSSPFSNPEMTEWFQAGYFTVSLLVKRGCDDVFQPLGDIMKIWGRVPFTPGPAPPPLQGDGDQERLKRQQELTALNLYQLQQLQYQYLLRQQYAQALAQQKAATLNSAPLQQQQQHQQQINLLLQQYQALKTRASESLLPPVTRSLSVPDSGSVWEMQNPSSQASCTPNLQQAAPSTWDGGSVWDLPIDSVAQAPTIEQMQQLEKSKAAKLELERREAEMRAKREEEERKRLEEALRARQEEERKRLEEEELARKQQEEVLRRQREHEEAQRRQKEEEERLAQEEALRRLEERRREEEERRKREEFLRKQLPSSSKWGQQSGSPLNQTQNTLSLAEIQKLEEEREQQTSLSNSVWGSVNTSPCTNWGSDSIWGDTQNSNMGFWDEAVKEAVQQPPPTRKGSTQKNNKGNANLRYLLRTFQSGRKSVTKHMTNMSNSQLFNDFCLPPAIVCADTRSNSLSGRVNKKVEEEEKLLKLFQGVNKSQQDTFMQWCEQTLHTLNTANNLDGTSLKICAPTTIDEPFLEAKAQKYSPSVSLPVPTFASFLKEVDSPYEVHDYVRAYLGDTPEAKDFAKQFLERRAKQNANQQKPAPQIQQQTHKPQQDSVWGGTGSSSLYQSNHTSGQQQQRFETVTSGKKKKKQKMVRADPSLLGFSVNAASERLNMGEIETLED